MTVQKDKIEMTKSSLHRALIRTKEDLPFHLRKYIVEQNYDQYSPIDQAVWRFIIKRLKAHLSINAHTVYMAGMDAAGLSEKKIPVITEISQRLEKFGWTALPVSGFIPPAAFMELQSLQVLPIACDMRTLEHLQYTPAPDIVHEAAGHAPILIDPEYSAYLRRYASVAKKAIMSQEDLDLYNAIREVSDTKESPNSSPNEIIAAEKKLSSIGKSMSHVSEAALLSRMNWWTAEYGLFGDLSNPKIFGAGLLSSVGESKWCLSSKVVKIPLTLDCINTTYDITEPQPQLFVTPNFKHLGTVLDELSEKMAYKVGGLFGLNKAIEAKSVCTVELNSGVQISGVWNKPILTELNPSKQTDNLKSIDTPIYLKTNGPTQLSVKDSQLEGHGNNYHSQGYGTPLGELKDFPNRCPSTISRSEWASWGLKVGNECTLIFSSGVRIVGIFNDFIFFKTQIIGLSLTQARTTLSSQVLFEPTWGIYDIVFGLTITSVFGGPADRESFGVIEDFKAHRVHKSPLSPEEIEIHELYSKVRSLRMDLEGKSKESFLVSTEKIANEMPKIIQKVEQKYPNEWLLRLECVEILDSLNLSQTIPLLAGLKSKLSEIASTDKEKGELIKEALDFVK